MRTTLITLALTLPVALPAPASAKDVAGKFGFGASASSVLGGGEGSAVPATTIDAVWWLSNELGLEGKLGVLWVQREQEIAMGRTENLNDLGLRGGIGLFYNFLRKSDVNVGLGGRFVGDAFFPGAPEGVDSETQINLGVDVVLRGEYFFSDAFAVNGQVGIGLSIDADDADTTDLVLGTTSTGVLGALGFVFYVD